MSNNRKWPRNLSPKLQYKNKPNFTKKSKNFYQLATAIKTEVKSILSFDTQEMCFEYIENLIYYLEKTYPKDLKELTFDTDTDNLSDLVNALTELLFSKGEFVIIDTESTYKMNLSICKRIEAFNDSRWYDLSIVSLICSLKSKELKIGIAHLLANANKNQSDNHNLINRTFEKDKEGNLDTGFFYDLNEMAEMNDLNSSDVERYLRKCKRLKFIFESYAAKDINIFLNYNPTCKIEKKIKRLLIKMIKTGFEVFHFFAETSYSDTFGSDSDSISFLDLLIVMFDYDETYESEYLEYYQEIAMNNGMREPCSVKMIRNKKVVFKTTKKNEKDFLYMCDSVYNLWELIRNKNESKN